MNPEKFRLALNTIMLGLGELSEALTDTPAAVGSPGQGREVQPAPPGSPVPTSYVGADEIDADVAALLQHFQRQAQPSLADESVDFASQGSLAQCPKHKSTYLPSKFKEGKFYCPADSDDPAWSNSKGKCRITPDNAAEYLRIKAAA